MIKQIRRFSNPAYQENWCGSEYLKYFVSCHTYDLNIPSEKSLNGCYGKTF